MSLTVVNVCNMALSKTGLTTRITSLDGTDVASVQCNTFYEAIRDLVLREHPWKFSNRLAQLTEISGYSKPGWSYTYEYPSDCLKARRLYRDVSMEEQIDQFDVIVGDDLETKYIVAEEGDEVYLEYTAMSTDPSVWSAEFVSALTARLASELVMPLQADISRKEALLKEYDYMLSRAKFSSAQEGYRELFEKNTFKDAR